MLGADSGRALIQAVLTGRRPLRVVVSCGQVACRAVAKATVERGGREIGTLKPAVVGVGSGGRTTISRRAPARLRTIAARLPQAELTISVRVTFEVRGEPQQQRVLTLPAA